MIAQAIVDHALRRSGLDGCVVVVTDEREVNLRWANSRITTNGDVATQTATVVSIADGSAGVSARRVENERDIDELVASAEAAATAGRPGEDATALVTQHDTDDHWHAARAQVGFEAFAPLVPALRAVFREARSRDRLFFGFAALKSSSTFVGSSTGLRRRADLTTGRLELTAKSADYASSAWTGVPVSDFAELDVEAHAGSLSRRLDQARRRISLPAGQYETILAPAAVADLMVNLYRAMAVREANAGRSVFAGPGGATRIGERLSRIPLSLFSDPFVRGLECFPFEAATTPEDGLQSVFDLGAPATATTWIDRGVLSNLVRPRYLAAGTEDPAQFVPNLVLDGGGTATVDDLVGTTERGLLVASLSYIRSVDPRTLLLTGLTRDGVYLIEDGKIRGAVNNFRFNESPVDLLGRISEAGASVQTLSRGEADGIARVRMPCVRVPDFTMSSVSEAS